jgi:hypothetical protein
MGVAAICVWIVAGIVLATQEGSEGLKLPPINLVSEIDRERVIPRDARFNIDGTTIYLITRDGRCVTVVADYHSARPVEIQAPALVSPNQQLVAFGIDGMRLGVWPLVFRHIGGLKFEEVNTQKVYDRISAIHRNRFPEAPPPDQINLSPVAWTADNLLQISAMTATREKSPLDDHKVIVFMTGNGDVVRSEFY